MTRLVWSLSILGLLLITGGCGTRLAVRSVSIPENAQEACNVEKSAPAACKRFNDPKGLVVNQRARYHVTAKTRDDGRIRVADPSKPQHARVSDVAGVDQDRLLVVDYQRLPFANGKLTVTLDESQAIKKVGITSEVGEPLVAVDSIVDAERDVRKAKKEEEAADEE